VVVAQCVPHDHPRGGPVNVLELEPPARQHLSRMAYDYPRQGAAADITLRRNRRGVRRDRLKPRRRTLYSRMIVAAKPQHSIVSVGATDVPRILFFLRMPVALSLPATTAIPT